MRNLIFALPAALLLAGCETALNSGHVISVTSTVLGLRVAQQTQNETPELDFGYSRQTVVLEPTITNGTMSTAPLANTFGFNNASIFDFGLSETWASQSYQTGSDTNTSSKPIVPK